MSLPHYKHPWLIDDYFVWYTRSSIVILSMCRRIIWQLHWNWMTKMIEFRVRIKGQAKTETVANKEKRKGPKIERARNAKTEHWHCSGNKPKAPVSPTAPVAPVLPACPCAPVGPVGPARPSIPGGPNKHSFSNSTVLWLLPWNKKYVGPVTTYCAYVRLKLRRPNPNSDLWIFNWK